MDTILKGLQDLDGVHGAVVADANGQVLAYRAHAVYDGALLQEFCRSLAGVLDSVKLLHEDWESITAEFMEGKLLVRNIGAGSKGKTPAYTLSLIADARLNPSFAGVAVRVAVAKIKAHLEAGPVAPQRSQLSGSSPVQPASSRMSVPEATAGMSWSGLAGTSSLATSSITVADSQSSAFLTACAKQLARTVGPMAKLFVKEAVLKVAPDRPFSAEHASELVKELEKHLDSVGDVTEMRKLLKTL